MSQVRTISRSKAGRAPWGLLVKDIVILSCRRGDQWWLLFRQRFEPVGRVVSIPGTASPQGGSRLGAV